MEHQARRIIAVSLAHLSLWASTIGEYHAHDSHGSTVIYVHPGDHCRLDWYDAKQPQLF
jgi:hypothetical protein